MQCLKHFATIFIVLLSISMIAAAQQPLKVTGTITDPSGAALPKASVHLIDAAGHIVASTVADGQGEFSVIARPNSSYSLVISSHHFATLKQPLNLGTSAPQALTFHLAILGRNESVAVTARDDRDTDYVVTENSTASKSKQPILDTAQSVEIIPRAVLQDQKALTLADAIRNVSGAATDFAFNGASQPILILRGYQMISMTAQGPMSGAASYYLDGVKIQGLPINMADVQQVEVIKGPETVLYGRAEPGGIFNVVSRPLESVPSFAIEQTGTSYWTSRSLGEASGPLNHSGTLLARVAGSWTENRSNREFVRDRVGAFRFNTAWRPSSSNRIGLILDYTDQSYRNDYGIPADTNTKRPMNLPWSQQLNDAPELSYTHPFSAIIDAEHRFSDAWRITGRLVGITSATREVDITPYRYDLFTGNPCQTATGQFELCRYYYYARPKGRYRLHQEAADLHGNVRSGIVRNEILAGFDSFGQSRTGTMYLEELAPIVVANPVFPTTEPLLDINSPYTVSLLTIDKTSWNSGYIQDNLTIGKSVHAVAALRFDGTSAIYASPGSTPNKANFVSPRLGAVWQFLRGQSAYAQYVGAVDANNGRDPFTGNSLQSERSRQYEFGYKTSLHGGAIQTTLAFYQIVKSNVANYDLYPTITTIGKSRSRGIEFDAIGRVSSHLSAIGSYGYTEAVVVKDDTYQGTFLADVPRHGGSLWARYAFNSHFDAGAGVFSQSRREGDQGNDFLLPGYARVDAMTAYAFNIRSFRTSLQLNANNLLNRHYFSGSHQLVQDWIQPGAPRTILLTLRISH